MGILRYLFKSDEQLDNEYEVERKKWIKTGGDFTKKMDSINKEFNRRAAKKNKKDPNRDPNYRWSDKNRWDKD